MHDPMTADVDTEVSANEKDQTRVTIVKVSTEGTEKDDDGNTIDLTDEEKAQKKDLAQQVLDKVKASDDVANADMDALAKEVDDSLSATAPAFTTAGSTDDTLDEAVWYVWIRCWTKMRQKTKRRRLFQKENLICMTAHWKTG